MDARDRNLSRSPCFLLSFAAALGLSLFGAALRAQDVVINEIVAVNATGLRDEDGDPVDWLELRNRTGETIDVGGWYLSDDPTLLTRWQLPSNDIAPGGFLLVFASAKDRAVAGDELHASFRLGGGGETVSLTRPDGVTVEHSIAYPRQREDISYGFAGASNDVFLAHGSVGTYLVPTNGALGLDWTEADFDDALWSSGTSGIGFDTGAVDVPDDGENIATDGAPSQSSDYSASFPAERAVDGNFGNFTATASSDSNPWWELDLHDVRSLASIVVHNRGDGCCQSRLRDITVTIRDGAGEEVWESAVLNPENELGGGGVGGPAELSVDLIALTGGVISGRYIRISRASDPDLSGTGGAGGGDEVSILSIGEVEVFEAVGGLLHLISTDIETEMHGVNASLYARFPFELADGAIVSTFSATFTYDDGLVAYLNGAEIARVGASGSPPSHDASASAAQPQESGASRVEISLDDSVDLLLDGSNVLAIHALNVSADDADFVISAELRGGSISGESLRFFETPTPEAPNDTAGVIGFVGDTTFSVDRGFFTDPFDVEITSSTPGATIRYTTNGRAPTQTSGTVYNRPISIDGTTNLRAIAYKPGFRSTNVDTHTYIFPADVVEQGVLLDDITGHPTRGPAVLRALTLMPTVSVTAASSSIPSGSEALASVELIHPDGSRGFQEDVGIKRVGGHSLGAYPKNNMRLYFRREYGASKLRYPLFDDLAYGEGAIEKFDRLNLRGGSHDSIFYLGAGAQSPSNATYTRNRFMNDLQLEMGRPSLRGRFVHLYINGTYWGHYQLMESPSAAHAAEYSASWNEGSAGGEKEDFEAVRRGAPIGSSAPAWSRIRSIRGDWNEVLRWVDVPNFVDYMLLNFWAGNAWDWREAQNWAAEGPSNPDEGGYKFLCWDSDIVMRRTDDSNIAKGGPDYLFRDLLVHEEFRIALADGIHRLFYNDGLLTPARVAEVHDFRAEQVRDTLIAESARWRWQGRLWLPTNQWQSELDRLSGDFFPRRTAITINQMRGRGWFLDVEPPTFLVQGRAQHGGWVEDGATLTMSGEAGGGDLVETDLIGVDSAVSVWVPDSGDLANEWTRSDYVEGTHGETWRSGMNGVGYDTGDDYDEFINVDVEDEMRGAGGNTSVYIRLPFEIASQAEIDRMSSLTLEVAYDDGFVAHLNGDRVADDNAPASPDWSSRALSGIEANPVSPSIYDISGSIDRLRVGVNLLAIHGMNSSTNSSDLLVVATLVSGELVDGEGRGAPILYTRDGSDPRDPGAETFEAPIELDVSTLVKARVRSGGEWSAVSEAVFAVDSGLRITEIMYHPSPPDDGSPYRDEDFEFLELKNVSCRELPLTGYSVGGAVSFEFSGGAVPSLVPGELVVVVNNLQAFATRYDVGGMLIAGQFSGRLSNSGEALVLRGAADEHIIEMAYSDVWYPVTDGQGPSLVIVDDGGARDSWALEASWRPSSLPQGSPGFDESEGEGGFRVPGDTNDDARLDISDAVAFLRFLFVGGGIELPCGDGTLKTESNRVLLDSNGDGEANLSDAVTVLNYLFNAGPSPVLGTRCVRLPDCVDRCL